ncbi:uncharacterized protein LOC127178623 [Labeo rohita]|uniref:uncharacterized protein LOC127178623 n=1 Tax=Labeo rohita TaxID=84645 RepID=UPI0021E28724|nr:uncharacterized protein LOC127178623 [Labeo rohita]
MIVSVVALLLCIVLSSEASDILQCTGERQSDGQFCFHMSYDFKDGVRDCETQRLIDEKVADFSEAAGNAKFMPPLAVVMANTTIIQTCPSASQDRSFLKVCSLLIQALPVNESTTLIMHTALLFAVLFPCLSFNDGKSIEGETCVGIRREGSSYDFDLPDGVAVNVQDPACDAEWTIDRIYTAILDRNLRYFSHPFKNLSRYGISASYCPASVRYHVSCPTYTKNLICSCTNSTDSNSVFSTILPSRDTSLSAMKTGLSKRKYYCTIVVAATFVPVVVILTYFICRTNRMRDGT